MKYIMGPECVKYQHMATTTVKDLLKSVEISFHNRDFQPFFVVNGVGDSLLESIKLLSYNAQRPFLQIDARAIADKEQFVNLLSTAEPGTGIIIDHISEFDNGHNPDSLVRFAGGLFKGVGYQENLVLIPEILDKLYKTGCLVIGVDYEDTPKVIHTGTGCFRMFIC